MRTQGNFHDEILNIIRRSVLLQFVFVALGFSAFLLTYLRAGILSENARDNDAVCDGLQGILTAYTQYLNSPFFDFDAENFADDDARANQFLIMTVQFMNRQGHAADFYLFDDDCALIICSSFAPLRFMPPATGKNWGVYKKMTESPNVVQSGFFHGAFLVGKKIARGYAVFVVPPLYFTNHMLERPSNIVVANAYGDVYLSSTAIFTSGFNMINPLVARAKSFFAFRSGWYYKTSRLLRLGNESVVVHTFSSIRSALTAFALGALTLLCVIVALGVASYASAARSLDKKTEAVGKIVACLNEVRRGNLTSRMNIDADNEFRIIADSYNTMIQSISDLLKQNEEIHKETARAQIKQLESQFNPHFLFNTLEVIKYMVRLDADSVPALIGNLSKLLRYSISAAETNSTLREDLEHTKNYMAIQKCRFTDSLNFALDIADETLSCEVPKLLIQPIIENAITHGFDGGGKRSMTIRISAHIEGGDLIIKVSDDGAGMNRETLGALQAQLASGVRPAHHFGLYNINRRIQLLYGKKSAMIVESAQGVGASVTIRFPARSAPSEYV